MSSRLRALRVLHPFPSLLNTALVFGLAVVANASLTAAALLAMGMLGLQLCIGITNDLVDEPLDARTKPWKPIPAGLISVRTARYLAALAALVGLAGAAFSGVVPLVLWCVMLAAGLLYDVRLKPTVFSWACYSVAFAALPVYAWFGAAGTLPPQIQLVVPLAALAGPALQLSNGLTDLEADKGAGASSLAIRLGRGRALAVIAVLLLVIHSLAWLTLAALSAQVNLILAAGSLAALAGIVFSARSSVRDRQAGWSLQAVSICLLALGWLSSVA
jgi:4-hydroxybenzoate polyprenyltransferase